MFEWLVVKLILGLFVAILIGNNDDNCLEVVVVVDSTEKGFFAILGCMMSYFGRLLTGK